jgi:mitochondrial fission protein ELM1
VERVAPKIARFHAALASAGVSRPLSAGLSQWRYPSLAEADRAADRVASLLAPA